MRNPRIVVGLAGATPLRAALTHGWSNVDVQLFVTQLAGRLLEEGFVLLFRRESPFATA